MGRTQLTLVDVKASEPSVPGMRGPPPGITFDRFVRACVVVKTLTESFQVRIAKIAISLVSVHA